MKLARGLFKILKEILRHLLRRPVVGINIIAKVPDGRIVMIRRGDTEIDDSLGRCGNY